MSSVEGGVVQGCQIGNLMDSRVSQLDDLLTARLRQAFHAQTCSVVVHELAKIASEYSAVDLAYAAPRFPLDARSVIYSHLRNWDAKVTFITNTDRNTRTAIFRDLSDEAVCELIERMPSDEAVYVVEDLPDRKLRRVLTLLKPERVAQIRELQRYERCSAGRMMTDEFFAFTMDVSIGEAASFIRDHPGIDCTRRIFVVDEARSVQGYVPVRNLVVNARDLPLRKVMQAVHQTVGPEASREEVVDLVERYKIPSLPVINADGALIGVITNEDVVEAIEDMADATIARMGGTLERVSTQDPILRRFFARAPWLVFTLFAGLVTSTSISYFQSCLDPWLVCAVFFVPLITGMSGNVGVQCSTVLVRSMAIGMLSQGKKADALWNEFAIGLLTGVLFGVACGGLVYLLSVVGLQQISTNPLAVAVIVGSGLCGASLMATTLGVFSPLFFSRVGVDPAVASGPIVAAFNDVFSTIIYFLIARCVSSTLFLSV